MESYICKILNYHAAVAVEMPFCSLYLQFYVHPFSPSGQSIRGILVKPPDFPDSFLINLAV